MRRSVFCSNGTSLIKSIPTVFGGGVKNVTVAVVRDIFTVYAVVRT